MSPKDLICKKFRRRKKINIWIVGRTLRMRVAEDNSDF